MPTELQKKAVNALVENGGIVSKAMEDAGYSPKTAKTPQKLTESQGFKELCEEYGLTDKLLLESLVEDIKKKPQNRKPELELGAKIKGLLTEKVDITSQGEKIIGINYIVPKENGNNAETNLETTSSVSST